MACLNAIVAFSLNLIDPKHLGINIEEQGKIRNFEFMADFEDLIYMTFVIQMTFESFIPNIVMC